MQKNVEVDRTGHRSKGLSGFFVTGTYPNLGGQRRRPVFENDKPRSCSRATLDPESTRSPNTPGTGLRFSGRKDTMQDYKLGKDAPKIVAAKRPQRDEVDEAGDSSFPASDPPAYNSGAPHKRVKWVDSPPKRTVAGRLQLHVLRWQVLTREILKAWLSDLVSRWACTRIHSSQHPGTVAWRRLLPKR